MPIELHPKEVLINAALMTKRPVAFLVGSPLSLKDGTGVPGIITMLDFVRAEIRDLAAHALPQFESAISGKSGAEAYQAAMNWLGVNAGQDAVNEVIKKAVLQARKPTAGECPAGSNGKPEEWNLPAGTTGLAELVTRGGDKFLGPILTTNFDPLISLGIRKSGGQTSRRVLTVDGTLASSVEDEPGIYSVIHLHGFWRESDTLHTQAQLTNPRPKLKASLQRLLVAQRRTLIVAAYGGWDDVFTQALVELMNDEQAQLDVIWCFYESDPVQVEKRYGKLLHAVTPAIVLNRFRPYGGIDCHSIFTEILATLQGMSAPAIVASAVSSPLAGWEYIDSTYLDSLQPLRPDEIVRYFDGAVPSWPHAVSAAIPRRQDGKELTKTLAEIARDNEIPRSLHLIRAAGGEGKSTLLLQVAADAVRSGNWSVLWRTSPKESISLEQVAHLDSGQRWLIVADDADTFVADLANLARQLSQSRRQGIHFLLAARDVDWKSARGPQQSWEHWLTYFPDITLRSISYEDAKAVVSAWEQLGNDGLRQLSYISNTEQRVAAFEAAISDAKNLQAKQEKQRHPQEGSFFGGLLAVRFRHNGLQAHVRDFLQRLQNIHIEHSKSSLFDALLYVAACHGTGIPGIDERVLADLVGVPREWVQRLVVRPLGEEATAVHSAGYVLTRHSQVAEAILVETEKSFGIDLAEVFRILVSTIAMTGREIHFGDTNFPMTIHAGPRLQRALPPQIPKARRRAIAIAAAKAAVTHKSEWLGCIVDLGKTYRDTRDYKKAATLFRDNIAVASTKIDYNQIIRAYWYEWGVCEGVAGDTSEHRAADAWLQGLSLSDHLTPAPITADRGKLSCAGLGLAFGKLSQPTPDCPYAKARRAVTFIGRRFGYDPKSHFFDHHDREADELGTPYPRNIPEAIAWLTAGVAQAGSELQDDFLKALLEPGQVSFNLLWTTLEPDTAPRTLGGHPSEPSTLSVATRLNSQWQQQSNQHEDRIQAGIERVINEAWKAVPPDTAPENRLQLAIQKARQTISRLSPHIKRQVGAHFQTNNWEPLKSREPKP